LFPGDYVRVLTAGGGGYGPPWQREAARVLEDVRLGYVSVRAAAGEYGVAIDGRMAVDAEQTARLRAAMASGKEGKA
jgi:N-methylhydantoinase B